MTLIYLGLGTNLGDRIQNLVAARAGLAPEVQVLRASPIYETAPWGYTDQPAFLNQVVEAQTILAPLDLLTHVKQIEASLGRVPTFRYGPRLMDIDILLYGSRQVQLPELVIPHPRLVERAFMLAPLADLAPAALIPGLDPRTVRECLASLDCAGVALFHA
jgi:2-amino-4-hydroxy-6-hydroxymethyldihydropteridine diphosphokinase